jgi:hypothetical protein
VYRYISTTERKLDLTKEDFTKTDRWKRVTADKTEMFKGYTVQVADQHKAGGIAGMVYRYLGKNKLELDLSKTNYLDTQNWEVVKPVLDISMIEAGQRWMIHDGAGRAYTLTKTEDGQFSITRNAINATSVAASAAISFGGGNAVAVSGAGAVAINSVMGSTDAVLRQAKVVAKGDVVIQAHSDASISSRIAALSAAIAAGGGAAGVGASIGVSVARNLIGQEGFGAVGDAAIATTRALVIDSSITSEGDLQMKAASQQTISALVVAGSAAVGP